MELRHGLLQRFLLVPALAVVVLCAAACGGGDVPDGAASPTPGVGTVILTPTPTPTSGAGDAGDGAPAATPTAEPAVGTATPTVEPAGGTPTPTPAPALYSPPDGFVAAIPSTLRAGYDAQASVSLFDGDAPASGAVVVTLLRGNVVVASARIEVEGSGTVTLPVPRQAGGTHRVEVEVEGLPASQGSVEVVDGTLVFLETDKPIYKPGQTLHVRLMTLDAMLKPWLSEVTVEVQDAKGIKVFKALADTDEYGMAEVELPLSSEPNTGVWKVTALAGDQTAIVDVRVERYVLPKYEVVVDTAKTWVLVDETIAGTVSAEYSFGKPVVGEVVVVATRYVGQWEEFARYSGPLDGQAEFELAAVQYVSGVPGAQGMGNVSLEVTVREMATGYEEKTTRLLTVAATPTNLRLIPDSTVFKPGLPLGVLVVTETPDGAPLDREVDVSVQYVSGEFEVVRTENTTVSTVNGTALLEVTPPEDAVGLGMEARSGGAYDGLGLRAGHSPSGGFIHLSQVSEGPAKVGDRLRFHVASTRERGNFYYEVLSRGAVIFSDVSYSPYFDFTATQLMAPSSRLLVYQILPNNEVAADYLPFSVSAEYPHAVDVSFSEADARPGAALDVNVRTQGEARVGLVAVDKSVFVLAGNRLNLQQVFNELERLYLEPQVELHEAWWYDVDAIITKGALETFQDAGVVVLTNKDVPSGEKHESPIIIMMMMDEMAQASGDFDFQAAVPESEALSPQAPGQLAEVQRVRQFFPETWLWNTVTTDETGEATLPVEAPDSITTWMLRAVAISKEHGLGIDESQLRVFQPFFVQPDLPYSVVRGEEIPVKLALYNYLDSPQEIHVSLEEAPWFELLDPSEKSVTVGPNDVGALQFKIRPVLLGNEPLTITARSSEAADAIAKPLKVLPEGVQRETVDNLVLSGGATRVLDSLVPSDAVSDSGRRYVAVTGNYLTQSIEGLDGLLQMSFGCGEQNMILFAPNVFVARYLKDTRQLKPEVMAKAEFLMTTGYQRELTYLRDDGSFSAFGQSDAEGSLWLTAFVLKTFAQASGLMYIDGRVLDAAAQWIVRHQRPDGSFEPVGFLHHQELLGGLKGNTALTAYVAGALQESGRDTAARNAVRFLEAQLDSIDDAYTMAITAYALELAGSGRADDAYEALMAMAQVNENGMSWGGGAVGIGTFDAPISSSASIETTGYALLALLEHGDGLSAAQAAKWLSTRRNSFGGFGSTQDTVVALQALTAYSTAASADVDMTVTLESGDWTKTVSVTPANADVLQTVQVPGNGPVTVTADGRGDAVVQFVVRYNLPEPEPTVSEAFQIEVTYGTKQVEVDDLITVSVDVLFNPPLPLQAGMVVLDVSVPTGFDPVHETIAALVDSNDNVKRYEVAGRKVILYIEDMSPGQSVSFEFQAKARYPVKAKGVSSRAYSYYRPEWQGETLGAALVVVEEDGS